MAKSKEVTPTVQTPQDIEIVVPADLLNTEEYRKLAKQIEERKLREEQVLRNFVEKVSKATKKKFRSYEHLVNFITKAKKSRKKK